MLGDPVEFELEVAPGAAVETGQVIGWIEGFKAVTDVFCPMDGRFAGANPALDGDITLLQSAPFERGWLFAVHGSPAADVLDAQGYAQHLDATIDRMLGKGG
jgi:glycine cleavage system H protein